MLDEFSDQPAGSCGEWKTYTPQFDNVDNVLENEFVLQHDLINCITQQDKNYSGDISSNDVMAPTTLLSQLNSCFQQSESNFVPAAARAKSQIVTTPVCNTDIIFDDRLRPQAAE